MRKNIVHQNGQAEGGMDGSEDIQRQEEQDVWQKDVHVKSLDFQPWALG